MTDAMVCPTLFPAKFINRPGTGAVNFSTVIGCKFKEAGIQLLTPVQNRVSLEAKVS